MMAVVCVPFLLGRSVEFGIAPFGCVILQVGWQVGGGDDDVFVPWFIKRVVGKGRNESEIKNNTEATIFQGCCNIAKRKRKCIAAMTRMISMKEAHKYVPENSLKERVIHENSLKNGDFIVPPKVCLYKKLVSTKEWFDIPENPTHAKAFVS